MQETALITGCSSGIGRATALAFLDDDWTVYATARDPGDVADLADAGCETLELDVTDPEECKVAVENVFAEEGRIDCLVNNAGFAQLGPVEDVPPRLVRRQYDVNVFGPHRLVREALPHMRAAGKGTVVNVSSVVGLLSLPGAGVYASSKAALESMTDALRPEAAEFGVDVVLIEPGPVATEFRPRAYDELEELDRSDAYDAVYEALADRRELGNLGAADPEEVADAVLDAANVVDPDSRYVVGEVGRVAAFARYLPDGLRDTAFRLVARVAR